MSLCQNSPPQVRAFQTHFFKMCACQIDAPQVRALQFSTLQFGFLKERAGKVDPRKYCTFKVSARKIRSLKAGIGKIRPAKTRSGHKRFFKTRSLQLAVGKVLSLEIDFRVMSSAKKFTDVCVSVMATALFFSISCRISCSQAALLHRRESSHQIEKCIFRSGHQDAVRL